MREFLRRVWAPLGCSVILLPGFWLHYVQWERVHHSMWKFGYSIEGGRIVVQSDTAIAIAAYFLIIFIICVVCSERWQSRSARYAGHINFLSLFIYFLGYATTLFYPAS